MEKQEDILFVESSISLKHLGQVLQLVGEIPYFVEKNVRLKGSGNYLSDSPILTLG